MKKNLVKELGRRIGLGLAGLAAIVGLSGCVGMSEDKATAGKIVGRIMQFAPYATPGERALGSALEGMSDYSHDMNVANEGRTQVNVNVGNVGTTPRIPENIVVTDNGMWEPAPGYMWANNHPKDHRVLPAEDRTIKIIDMDTGEISKVLFGKPRYLIKSLRSCMDERVKDSYFPKKGYKISQFENNGKETWVIFSREKIIEHGVKYNE